MTTQPPLISVICCAHNEEEYVDRSIPNVLKALKGFPHEIIFVADRCTDKTVEKVGKYKVKVVEKNWKKWTNSYAESLQTGYLKAKGKYMSIIDADIIIPTTFFRDLVPILKGRIASVAAHVVTYPDTLLNRVKYAWERTYSVAPLGRAPYGAARIICKESLDEINGFRDVPAPDTDIDMRLVKKGYRSVGASVKVYHIRRVSFRGAVSGQINRGRARYVLGISLIRTVGHALFRLRPFTVCGWLLEWQTSLHIKRTQNK